MIRITVFLFFFLNTCSTLFAQTDKLMTYSTVSVPITDMVFVYTQGYGSINQEYNYEEVVNYVLSFGYKPERMTVMFLSNFRSQEINEQQLPQDLTTEYLEQHYGKAILNTKGKVLIGVLVPPQVGVIADKKFKILKLHNITVKAFQSLSKDTIKKVENKDGVPNSSYTMPHRIFDRLVMMNFIGLDNNQNKYSAMLEMYDVKQDVYTFMALPTSVTTSLIPPSNQNPSTSNTIPNNQFDN